MKIVIIAILSIAIASCSKSTEKRIPRDNQQLYQVRVQVMNSDGTITGTSATSAIRQ